MLHLGYLLWNIRPVLLDDKATSVQVTAWQRQVSNHYLSQGLLGSMSPYVVTRPQWFTYHNKVVGTGTIIILSCRMKIKYYFINQVIGPRDDHICGPLVWTSNRVAEDLRRRGFYVTSQWWVFMLLHRVLFNIEDKHYSINHNTITWIALW